MSSGSPDVQSITTNRNPAKKWAALARALSLAFALTAISMELAGLAQNAGFSVPLPGFKRAMAAAFFWLPRQPPASREVAQLTSARGPLKIRAGESPIWEDAPSTGQLRSGQSLRTLEHGTATLALGDGSELTLDENTAIELTRHAAKIELNLLSGSIHRRLADDSPRRPGYHPTLEISAPEASIAVPTGAQFSLRRGAEGTNGRLDLRVLDGEIGLHAATGSFLLKPGEEAVEIPSSGFEFHRMPFVLLSPRVSQAIGESRARFEWSVDPELTGGGPLELQIGADPAFEKIVKVSRIAATEPPLRHVTTRLDLPLELAGDHPWYWRVRSMTDTAVVSDASAFWSAPPATTLLSSSADTPLARPRLRLPLEAATAVTGKPLDFVWSAVAGARGYEVDVEGRDQPLVASGLQASLASTSDIPLGRRIWRVRARLANAGLSPWSDPRTLIVVPDPAAGQPPRKPASSSGP